MVQFPWRMTFHEGREEAYRVSGERIFGKEEKVPSRPSPDPKDKIGGQKNLWSRTAQ